MEGVSKIVNDIYDRYKKVVKKDEKIKKIKTVLQKLGISYDERDIRYDEIKETAYAMVYIENEKVEEIARWLTQRETVTTHIIVTENLPNIDKKDPEVDRRASKIGLEYHGFRQIDDEVGCEYYDYFILTRIDDLKVILRVYSYWG